MRPLLTEPDLAERIQDALRSAICSGELAPGTRLIQDDLARQFGVSRQPVLQAMQLLRREGFVTDSGRRGVSVAPLDADHARNLYVVRAALDGAAARLAAGRFVPETAERGRALIGVGRLAAERGDVPGAIEADIDFHLFIYDASGNPLLSETAQPHWQHLRRVMGAVLSAADLSYNVWDEHEAILAALEARDGARAETLLRAHAENAADILAQRLGGPGRRAA